MRDGRVWPGLAALALAVALAACGGTEVAPAPTATPTAATTPAASPTPTVADTPTAIGTPAASPTPTATAANTPTAVPTPTAESAPTASPMPTPVVMRYGAPDPDGIVDAPGEYAFFSADGPITTYESLRQDVEQLVIHERDVDGASWASFYDGVEAGDDFEWREADDCWIRYLVDEVLPDPTDAPLKALAVRGYAYAYAGCDGTVPDTATGDHTWSPAILSHPDFTTAIRFGPFFLYQPGWKGEYPNSERTAARYGEPGEQREGRIFSTDLAVVRQHPLWREPDLPDGWTLTRGETGTDGQYGYWAHYAPPSGSGVNIVIGYRDFLPRWEPSSSSTSSLIQEMRIIDGHPALVEYSPVGTPVPSSPYVVIYHEATGIFYEAYGVAPSLKRAGANATIEIARSLYLEEEPP